MLEIASRNKQDLARFNQSVNALCSNITDRKMNLIRMMQEVSNDSLQFAWCNKKIQTASNLQSYVINFNSWLQWCINQPNKELLSDHILNMEINLLIFMHICVTFKMLIN